MSWIVAENIMQIYGADIVLDRVSARLGEADRVGLVGPNGEGKTTLVKVLARLIEPTEGTVNYRRGLKVGYLPQETPALSAATIRSAMLDVFADQRKLEHQIHELSALVADEAGALEELGELQTQFDAAGGYDYLTRIDQILTGLGFAASMWDRPLDQLSGGQRTRVYLATLLGAAPDVLMLDEPTNHLDIESVEWLEQYLRGFRGALLVVSHDRYFLNSVTETTWEVAFGGLETFRGSYSKYVNQRAERHVEREKQYQAQQAHIAKTKDFIHRHLAGQRTKEAQGRRRRLERFMRDEAIARPQEHGRINLDIASGQRTGDLVLRAADLAIGYDPADVLVEVENLEVLRGQRIAIVGSNGTGKTTLIRTILGQLEALGGTIKHGAKVETGYLSQTQAELDQDSTAIDAVAADGLCTTNRARDLLGALLLSGDDALKKVCELSGGQRSRVILARLVAKRPNVLVLDEPTNHLDIPSTEIIEEVLAGFEGTVLFVSHDRYLISAIATHIWVIEAHQLHVLHGGWDRYLQWRTKSADHKAGAAGAGGDKGSSKANFKEARKKANLLQRMQRQHDELEELIDQAEQRLTELNGQISAAGEAGDIETIEKLGNDYKETDSKLAELLEQWEQLGQRLTQADG